MIASVLGALAATTLGKLLFQKFIPGLLGGLGMGLGYGGGVVTGYNAVQPFVQNNSYSSPSYSNSSLPFFYNYMQTTNPFLPSTNPFLSAPSSYSSGGYSGNASGAQPFTSYMTGKTYPSYQAFASEYYG
jgi:hypothetical protein